MPGDPTAACIPLTLTLTADARGARTHWAVVDPAGPVHARGVAGGPPGEPVDVTVCVPPGCHDLVLLDEDADGLCCDHGAGAYALREPTGVVIAAGGRFSTGETTSFCLYAPGAPACRTLAPPGRDAACGPRASDGALTTLPAPPNSIPWRGGGAVLVALALTYALWRDRDRRLDDLWAAAGAAVVAMATGVVFALGIVHGGPLIAHDAVRDLLWALDLAEGGPGPTIGPQIGMTAGRLGRVWYALLSVPLAWGTPDALVAAVVAVRALGAAATYHVARAVGGPLVGVVAVAWLLLLDLVADHHSWLTHANVALITAPLAVGAAWRAHGQGRSAQVVPMMLWASLSVHLHLTAVAVPLGLVVYALAHGRDARWPDTLVALAAASLPFAGGVPLFVDAVWRQGVGPALLAQTAAVPALAVGMLLVRPRTMTVGWPARGLGALLGVWAVVWLAAGRPPLRLFDLIIAFDGGVAAAASGAPPWGATLWRLLSTRAMVPWDAAIVGVAALVGVGVAVWRRDAAARAFSTWLLASAAVTLAVMAAAGPEPRYAWLFAQPWAIALGLGTVVVWRRAHAAADRAGSVGRVGLALAALATGWAVPSYKAPAVWIAAVPGVGAAWRAPWAGRIAGVALAVGLWGVVTARWAEGNTPGLLHVDLHAFRAQAALPGVGEDGVLGCVHRLGPPVAPLPGSWLLFASLAPPARDVDTCRAAWVVDAPTPFENTPGAVPVGPDDRVAFPEFARVRPGQGAMTAVLDDGVRSWAVAGRPLPFRSAAYRPVPPFTARIGLFPWVLRDRAGGPAAQAEVVVDAHGAWAHTLAVRVAAHPLGDPPPRCAVTVWGPEAPLAPVPGGDPHASGLWRFQLTPALHGVPLTVAVAGCPVESLDVFPVSGVRTSSVDAPVR